MNRKDHRKVAKELALALGLDDYENWAELGADLPDLDLYIGKHRKTLHNLHLSVLSSVIPDDKAKVAYLLGMASHLITDKLSKHINATKEIASLMERFAEL